MSKKPKKQNNEDMLDDALISQVAEPTKDPKTGEVNLLEYSKTAPYSFNANNYILLFAGLGINILGFILMIGGGSDDPSKFDGDALFSHVRITLAPALIVLGYAIIAFGIMRRAKAKKK